MVNTFIVESDIDPYVDSQFRPLVLLFKEEAEIRGLKIDTKNITLIFDLVDDDPDTIGACYANFRKSYIRIKTDTWYPMSPEEKEMLVFHELAHCVLGRHHCEVEEENVPISIMSPRILTTLQYKNKRKEYLDELFRPSNRCNNSN